MCLCVCYSVLCMKLFGAVLVLYLVYIVVIQGEVFQDTDVFRNVVISNVCVWLFVGYLWHCVGEKLD